MAIVCPFESKPHSRSMVLTFSSVDENKKKKNKKEKCDRSNKSDCVVLCHVATRRDV